MPVGLIISLGGSPEPIARTILEHQPQIVCYLASQQSVFILGDLKKIVQDQGITVPDSRVVLLDDANYLVHCFEKALECAKHLEEKHVPPDNVIVDYTGGTKNMTAALALATVRKGYSFSYVGGTVRNRNDLGTVQSRTEEVYTGVSPWQIFAVEEWQYLILYLKHYQYEAALGLIEETLPRQPKSEQLCWQAMKSTIDALLKWDQFNHREALPALSEGTKDLGKWISLKNDTRLREFLLQTKKCTEFLQKTAMATKGFQKLEAFFPIGTARSLKLHVGGLLFILGGAIRGAGQFEKDIFGLYTVPENTESLLCELAIPLPNIARRVEPLRLRQGQARKNVKGGNLK